MAVPAFNEQRFIGSVVVQLRQRGYTVLVIDDGSGDRTASVAEGAGAVVAQHPENQGKAEAVNTAFRHARRSGVECLVLMDGDAQHDPAEIERLIAPIERNEADIVIGSRFLETSDGDIPPVRRIGQVTMTKLTNLSSGATVTDSQSGYRAFSRRAIQSLIFASDGFSVEVEMQFQARDLDLNVVEVPIAATYTDPPKRNVLSHGFQVLDGILRLVGIRRPLFYFGYPGIVAMVLGAILGAYVTYVQHTRAELAIGYALITVLLVLVGLLSIFTAIILHSIRATVMGFERRLIELDVEA
ncbi:MAG: glycosyltransferase family 2 protein [Chloroflexota bacterium]